LRFVLDHKAVSVLIPGSSRPAHATSNAQATSLPPLEPSLHEELGRFFRTEVAPFIQGPY
jgi:aryl-alcohol dehydrogenase-like predicted oxidoreductase